MKVDTRLIRHLEGEDKQLLLSEVRSSKNLRKVIVKVLTDVIDSAIIRDESVDLSNDNALTVIAASRGYRRGIREAIKLLTTDTEDETQ